MLAPAAGHAQGEPRVDLTGAWIFTVTTDAGSGTPTVTFQQRGDTLSGHYSSQVFGELDFTGSITGREFTFRLAASVEGQSFAVTYRGTIESADSLAGTVTLGDLGSGSFTAKRRPPSGGTPLHPPDRARRHD
ncbi:MAG: hypothetical protein L0271_16235 [Gemmatimonadetes bacterium]|nr:hypothetical protein [Gemmatimonadota bacterium]